MVLLVIAVGLGWLLGYSTRTASTVAIVAARSVHGRAPIAELKAHVLHNKAITGPFTLAEIERLKSGAELPAEALFRLENTTEWVRWNELPWDGQIPAAAVKP